MHVLIVLLSLLCTCLLPLFCLSTQTYSLAALNTTVTCMHVSTCSCQQSCMVIHVHSVCTRVNLLLVCTSPLQLHRGISTLVLLIVGSIRVSLPVMAVQLRYTCFHYALCVLLPVTRQVEESLLGRYQVIVTGLLITTVALFYISFVALFLDLRSLL